MDINEKLKFSWGHIIAFVAMLVISYFSFLGLIYLTNANFILTGVAVVVIDIVIALAFIGVQVAKGTDHKFKKTIILERILVVIAPLALIVTMYPACHFWTVFDRRSQIEEKFHSSVSSSKKMFTDYESYTDNRCRNYADSVMKSSGTDVNKGNRKLALSLQLRDENYKSLKNEALNWIEKAKGATVWNVFMIANIKTIKDAILSWNKQLIAFSSKRMSDEPSTVAQFDSDSASLNQITANLDGIKEQYSLRGTPTIYAILMIILCYIFLMFPYVIQQRNTKSQHHLFYNEGRKNKKEVIIEDKLEEDSAKVEDDFDSFTM